MARYFVYDVFTERAFGGNPLAVVLDAERLDEDVLLPVAREFGFSETVFVLPPNAPDHAARLRIFTPTSEIPFAGHQTVGAAEALSEAGHDGGMTLELGVGPVTAQAANGRGAFTTTRPFERLGEVPAGLVARCGGLPEHALRTPPVIASMGLPFVLAELTDTHALALARPQAEAFREGEARHGRPGDLFAILFYVREGDAVRARMFAPLSSIPEDPVTGSAAAALAAHLADGGALRLEVTPGVEMGRPSRISVAVEGASVPVSGAATRVMEGRLVFPGAPA